MKLSYGNTEDRGKSNFHDPKRQQKRIFIMESNPILADGLASALIKSPHLSTYLICIEPVSTYRDLGCQASDILIIDPKQVLQGQHPLRGFFQERAKITALVGYCNDISDECLEMFKNDGFRAILLKSVLGGELARIVCAVAFGGQYFHEAGDRNDAGATEDITAVDLSERELAVLRKLAMGISMKQIAAYLDISAKTVDTYKNRASRKLNLTSRADIVQFAIKSGWMN